jgi:transposase
MAYELGQSKWILGFTTGLGQRPRERVIAARDLGVLGAEITAAKRRFGLPPTAPVVSCYEAGRDGFWLHRALTQAGHQNYVVDSSSIEVKRRARRTKSDRLDVRKLLQMLVRYQGGEPRVWSVVRVPTVADEDRRQVHRELTTVKRDRARVTNRIKGLLATQGVVGPVAGAFPTGLAAVRLWDGSPLPPTLRARLEREWEKVVLLTDQIRTLVALQRRQLRTATEPAVDQVRQLLHLRGLGPVSAWVMVMECFAWRRFRNRREVGALAGLVPAPYQSGGIRRDQGITKAGNRHVRHLAIELAWGWLRYQPDSALSRWYATRFGAGSSRLRRIGIVALARRLLIALWRYLETGVVPEGAVLKA